MQTLTLEQKKMKYSAMYHLFDLVPEQTLRRNILSYLLLRDELSTLYNAKEIDKSMKQVWLANILFVDSSIIESIMRGAIMIEEKTKPMSFRKRNGQDSNPYTFYAMTRELLRIHALTIPKKTIDSVRILRNNVHLSKMNYILEESSVYSASSLSEANKLVLEIADNLYANIHKLNNPI